MSVPLLGGGGALIKKFSLKGGAFFREGALIRSNTVYCHFCVINVLQEALRLCLLGYRTLSTSAVIFVAYSSRAFKRFPEDIKRFEKVDDFRRTCEAVVTI